MTITQQNAVAPVSLAEAKDYLRIEHAAEDALIGRLLASAAALCESFTGQALLARDVEETIPAQAEWRRLSLAPVRSIMLVEGLPADGAPFLLPVDAYALNIDADGAGWVRLTRPGAAGRARISYQAGMATGPEGVPEPLRQGIIRLAAHLHAHRDDAAGAGPPAAVAALWRPWRRMRLV